MTKYNILYLFPQNVIPPVDGGKIGIFNPIKELSKKFNVYCGFIAGKEENVEKEEYIKLGVKDLVYIKLNKKDNALKVARNFLEEEPFKWRKYYSSTFNKILENFVEDKKIDLIYVSSPHMFKYVENLKNKYDIPVIFREHNIEFDLVYQFYKFTKNPLYKSIAFWQYKKSHRKELEYWEKSDKVIFISKSDYNKALQAYDPVDKNNKFELVYDGFEIKNEYSFYTKEENSFLFTGSLKTIQNLVNFKWFVKNIWINLLRRNDRKYKLYITGNNEKDFESMGIKKEFLLNNNIVPLGFVENIDDVIKKTKYFISPTIMGSGIRIKVLHAMSLGAVVFLTPIDYEMVEYFKDMENVILFSNYEEFVEKLSIIENNSSLYQSISFNAYKTIKEKINWDIFANKIIFIIERVLKSKI